MSRFSAVAVGLLLAVNLAPTVGAVDPLEVALDSGIVRGVDAGATHEWRGIPYVAAPIGDLRWRSPTPVDPWLGVRDASEFGPHCIQLLSDIETLGNEDCLYLNVFTPPDATGMSRLPVMVHLHGGSNSGFWPYENAAAFVAHDAPRVRPRRALRATSDPRRSAHAARSPGSPAFPFSRLPPHPGRARRGRRRGGGPENLESWQPGESRLRGSFPGFSIPACRLALPPGDRRCGVAPR